MFKIKIRRAYEPKGKEDGYCILVDRLWPRGLKKEDLSYSWWPKQIAPSDELRQSFNHDEDKFDEFKEAYKQQLNKNELKSEFLEKVSKQLKKHNVTLLYGAKDEEHNQAVVLKQWTEEHLSNF